MFLLCVKSLHRCLAILFWSVLLVAPGRSEVRDWTARDGRTMKGEFVSADASGVTILRSDNGRTVKIASELLSEADLAVATKLARLKRIAGDPAVNGWPRPRREDFTVETKESIAGGRVSLESGHEWHLTGAEDPLAGGTVDLRAPDSWLVLEKHRPSEVDKKFLKRITVRGAPARNGRNVRLAPHGSGTIVVPHEPDFPALTVFEEPEFGGESMSLESDKAYDAGKLRGLKGGINSFILRRGYMATFAEHDDGTGISRNWVAQDHDVLVESLPDGLDDAVRFIRIFPWRWTAKKGIAGDIYQKLQVGWFYNWNISNRTSPDLEYVPIKQKRDWPGLDRDWQELGSLHLLGFNEPDRPDQANMKVDEAIALWPELLKTGLRLGSPAVSDGGLGWLYEFMGKAEQAKLRVDFVAVHYYRAVSDPGNPGSAADQIYRFCKEIHERTGRPVWITEWNNGANWTTAPDPDPDQQRAAIAAMVAKLDEAPFVERYALYNWVEDCRKLVKEDGSLTPAGEAYRNQASPVGFPQPASSD